MSGIWGRNGEPSGSGYPNQGQRGQENQRCTGAKPMLRVNQRHRGIQRIERLPERVAHERPGEGRWSACCLPQTSARPPRAGMIGKARHFAGKRGFSRGQDPNYPSGRQFAQHGSVFRIESQTPPLSAGAMRGEAGEQKTHAISQPAAHHVDSDSSNVTAKATAHGGVDSRHAHLNTGEGKFTSMAGWTVRHPDAEHQEPGPAVDWRMV